MYQAVSLAKQNKTKEFKKARHRVESSCGIFYIAI